MIFTTFSLPQDKKFSQKALLAAGAYISKPELLEDYC